MWNMSKWNYWRWIFLRRYVFYWHILKIVSENDLWKFESLLPRSKNFHTYVLEINDCREDSCYPGVKCIDLMAPKRGFKCDECPEGFTGNGMSCEKQGK